MLERCRFYIMDRYEPQAVDIVIFYAKYMTLSFAGIGGIFFAHLITPDLTELSSHVIRPTFAIIGEIRNSDGALYAGWNE